MAEGFGRRGYGVRVQTGLPKVTSMDPFYKIELLWHTFLLFLRSLCPRDRVWTHEDEKWAKRLEEIRKIKFDDDYLS